MNIVTLSKWRDSHTPSEDSRKAIQEREKRDWDNYRRALKRYRRSQKPLPVRLVLGLWDVAVAFVKGER